MNYIKTGFIPKKDIVIKDSQQPGSTTTIMVGVHGNELAGPTILQELIDEIEIIAGKVNFIFANLKALEMNQRQFEVNMNRCFEYDNSPKSYEQKRIQEILPYLDESDYLLDCHNTNNTNASVPILIGEDLEYAPYFDIPVMISGFDAIQPGSSDGYMYRNGKVGICLESGNLVDSDGPVRVKRAIINFLKVTQNIIGEPSKYKTTKYYHFDTLFVTLGEDFVLSRDFNDLESIQKGELIGHDGSMPIYAHYDGVLLFAHNRYAKGEEAFCMGRMLD